jgi:chemosensory pili system protein ChpA (sensor histidine kinase/response regulator)
MDHELIQNFLDEAELTLNAIRGELLVFVQNATVERRLELPFHRLRVLRENALEIGFVEIAEGAKQLALELGPLTGALLPTASQARDMLDRVAAIESQLAMIRISDEGFARDMDELIDLTFVDDRSPNTLIADIESSAKEPADEGDRFEIDTELLEVFAEEAENLLQNMGQNLERLVSAPDNKEALWEIRRNAHTFKGSAGIVGLRRPSELAHRVEDLLDRLAETSVAANEKIIPLLLAATECLRAMTEGEDSDRLNAVCSHLYSEFDAVLAAIHAQTNESVIEPRAAAVVEAARPAADSAPPGNAAQEPPHSIEPRSIVRVSLEKLDELVAIIRELVVNRSMVEQRLAELDRQVDELFNVSRRLNSTNGRLEVDLETSLLSAGSGTRYAPISPGIHHQQRADHTAEHFDALEFDRYTEFHQAIRELSETSTDASAISSSIEGIKDEFSLLLGRQRRLIDGIQERVMRVRMVAFGSLETRLERAVRVTCEDENKKAAIVVENGGLEIDTQVLDTLIEPLMHLLKNAVVHGIEYPETRRLLGKPETGQITIGLENEETHVVLTVKDDGSGIAASALKEKAVATGALSGDAANALSETEAVELIFSPGLTTAERLSLNAGRGVGMSIVRESVESAGGAVAVETAAHSGTQFTIRVPLKLALTNALLVTAGGENLAVPMKLVERMIEVSPENISETEDGPVIEYGGSAYNVRPLDGLLGFAASTGENGNLSALLVRHATGRHALLVDTVLRSEEIVIRPLGKPLDRIRGVLGAAFLGTGELASIIDLPFLLAKGGNAPSKSTEDERVRRRRKIMVVDDSPSVRHMTSKVVTDAGWEAVAAKDGLDAIEKLNAMKELPDVILTDIEMPRMGGFEFAAVLNADECFSEIPVVVITSRSADKHRERAKENGVAEYLVKPFVEAQLIEIIKRHSPAGRMVRA